MRNALGDRPAAKRALAAAVRPHRARIRRPLEGATWRTVGAVVLGASFGAATSLSNAGASQLAVVASIILDVGWAWAALAVAAGWLAGAPARGALAAVVALLAATTAYYALDSVLRDEPFALYWPELQRWWLASVAIGPALGAVGAYVGRAGVRGLLAGLVVPVGALVQMLVLPPGSGNLIVTPELRLARAIVLVASCVAAAAVLVRFLSERRR